MNSKNHTTLIFDFFGVLTADTAPFWLEKYFSPTEELMIKNKYLHPADIGQIPEEELFRELSSLVKETPEQVRQDWKSLVSINKEFILMIKELKKHYKVALCVNSPASFIREVLQEQEIEHLFDTIIVSSEIGVAKPDRAFFTQCADLVKEDIKSIVFIDDNVVDVKTATELGMFGIEFKSASDIAFLMK